MKMPSEVQKLRAMLTEMGIKWQDKSAIYPENKILDIMKMFNVSREIADVSIYRTHFDVIGCHYSVIYSYNTYGGDEGLLEMMVNGAEPTGWLTAEDIVSNVQERIKQCQH